MRCSLIVVAGGRGLRVGGDTPKQFLPLAGKPLLLHTLEAFRSIEAIHEYVLVLPKEFADHPALAVITERADCPLKKIVGGEQRQDSVYAGLRASAADSQIVLVHDAVRPFPPAEGVREAIRVAAKDGAAILALPVVDTIKQVDKEGRATKTVERESLWIAQTPQVFRREILLGAFEKFRHTGQIFTDDAALVESAGHPVRVVPGSAENFKITTPEDLERAGKFLSEREDSGLKDLRLGHGFDVHAFAGGRKLMLGGIEIRHDKGLQGHSDADALLHALCDALLGALGLGDIGLHFPDTDPAYKNISSRLLVEKVMEKVKAADFRVHQMDATVITEAPKLAPHFPGMKSAIQNLLGPDAIINLKATTSEGMGFTGRGEGLAAFVTVTLFRL
ncbi:MAG: 2-C-methyl-D-erythritol 4-phosphate cytidylyltransferase [bacterium]